MGDSLVSQPQPQRHEYQQEKLTYDDLTHLRIAVALFEANLSNKKALTKMYDAVPQLKQKINRMWEGESTHISNGNSSIPYIVAPSVLDKALSDGGSPTFRCRWRNDWRFSYF